jgi:hypothetical protein
MWLWNNVQSNLSARGPEISVLTGQVAVILRTVDVNKETAAEGIIQAGHIRQMACKYRRV